MINYIFNFSLKLLFSLPRVGLRFYFTYKNYKNGFTFYVTCNRPTDTTVGDLYVRPCSKFYFCLKNLFPSLLFYRLYSSWCIKEFITYSFLCAFFKYNHTINWSRPAYICFEADADGLDWPKQLVLS